MEISYRIERFQFGNWTIVRLNIQSEETARSEAAAMKRESNLPLRIIKVTEDLVATV